MRRGEARLSRLRPIPNGVRWAPVALAILIGLFSAKASAEPVPDTCRIHYPSDARIPWTCLRIRRQTNVKRLFGADWQGVLRFNRIDRRHIYPGVRLKVPKDLLQVAQFTPLPQTYAPAAQIPKFILVDLSEQFLGAYDFGPLAISFPITSGDNAVARRRTPIGTFHITAYDRLHVSSLYDLADTHTPYPMHYALRFLVTLDGVAVWIHGRDVPGYAASHGCIGLYDEQMQKEYYGTPRTPVLEDARTLYEWAIAPHPDDGRFHALTNGPTVEIIGHAPNFPPRAVRAAPQAAGRVPRQGPKHAVTTGAHLVQHCHAEGHVAPGLRCRGSPPH